MADFDLELFLDTDLLELLADTPPVELLGQAFIEAAVVDVTPPEIANVTPALGSLISRDQAIEFDTTDETDLRRVVVLVQYPSGAYEVVHDGDSFASAFESTSTRVAIAGGYHYTVLRTGYWLENPTVRVIAIDTGGNEADTVP